MIDKVCHGPGIAEHFAKVSSSLRTMLSALTFGNIGRIIGKARTNEFITRLEQGKRVILVCHTGSLLSPRASLIFGRVFVYDSKSRWTSFRVRSSVGSSVVRAYRRRA